METSFWKNLVLIIVFFTITPVALIISLFSLSALSKSKESLTSSSQYNLVPSIPLSGVKVYASLPNDFPSISGTPQASDARPEIIRQYLLKYKSPLSPYAEYIVSAADEYKIDYRLTTAIAQQESNLCKVIPAKTYNCWGWGIHSEGTLGFSSYENGIETVTAGLANEYIQKGYDTVEKIMSKYTPLSNGSWADAVNHFFSEME